ncbi:uncharacterized protein V2V93DRAFT_368194 [Kockiozyma suomiensis]|uniref:uncharacterized protein n=1 Tax=Kockiozyma suomiensis TaxID=1337062 RepID=UPI003343DF33
MPDPNPPIPVPGISNEQPASPIPPVYLPLLDGSTELRSTRQLRHEYSPMPENGSGSRISPFVYPVNYDLLSVSNRMEIDANSESLSSMLRSRLQQFNAGVDTRREYYAGLNGRMMPNGNPFSDRPLPRPTPAPVVPREWRARPRRRRIITVPESGMEIAVDVSDSDESGGFYRATEHHQISDTQQRGSFTQIRRAVGNFFADSGAQFRGSQLTLPETGIEITIDESINSGSGQHSLTSNSSDEIPADIIAAMTLMQDVSIRESITEEPVLLRSRPSHEGSETGAASGSLRLTRAAQKLVRDPLAESNQTSREAFPVLRSRPRRARSFRFPCLRTNSRETVIQHHLPENIAREYPQAANISSASLPVFSSDRESALNRRAASSSPINRSATLPISLNRFHDRSGQRSQSPVSIITPSQERRGRSRVRKSAKNRQEALSKKRTISKMNAINKLGEVSSKALRSLSWRSSEPITDPKHTEVLRNADSPGCRTSVCGMFGSSGRSRSALYKKDTQIRDSTDTAIDEESIGLRRSSEKSSKRSSTVAELDDCEIFDGNSTLRDIDTKSDPGAGDLPVSDIPVKRSSLLARASADKLQSVTAIPTKKRSRLSL